MKTALLLVFVAGASAALGALVAKYQRPRYQWSRNPQLEMAGERWRWN